MNIIDTTREATQKQLEVVAQAAKKDIEGRLEAANTQARGVLLNALKTIQKKGPENGDLSRTIAARLALAEEAEPISMNVDPKVYDHDSLLEIPQDLLKLAV